MARATWNGVVLAESSTVQVVEGNIYFPPSAVRSEYLRENETRTRCPWKGEASYYDIVVGDERLKDGAWTYREPKEAASEIKEHVAFWRGVTVEGAPRGTMGGSPLGILP